MKKAVIRVVDPENVVVNVSMDMKVSTVMKVQEALREQNGASFTYEPEIEAIIEALNEAAGGVVRDFVGLGPEPDQ